MYDASSAAVCVLCVLSAVSAVRPIVGHDDGDFAAVESVDEVPLTRKVPSLSRLRQGFSETKSRVNSLTIAFQSSSSSTD